MILAFLYRLLMWPGQPLAYLLASFKEMGDGTGNETSIIEYQKWCCIFGIIVWILLFSGIIWIFLHVSLTLH